LKCVLLDTTYILPLFGVGVKIPDLREKIISMAKRYHLLINSLSILEAKWKVLKLAKKKPDLIDSFSEGLLFLEHRKIFKIIPFYEYDVDLIATELHHFHNDYFDCSILASAFVHADIFATEEKKNMQNLIRKLPPDYLIYRKVPSDLAIMKLGEIEIM